MTNNVSKKSSPNICFLLGILVYVFMCASYILQYYPGDQLMIVLIFIMSGLFLIDAVDSAKLKFAGAAGVKKGILAFLCCAVQTIFARSAAVDLFPVGMTNDVINRFIGNRLLLSCWVIDDKTVFFFDMMVALLCVVTLAVIVLPVIGVLRKARCSDADFAG